MNIDEGLITLNTCIGRNNEQVMLRIELALVTTRHVSVSLIRAAGCSRNVTPTL